MSLVGGKKFGSIVSLNIDYALSAFSRDKTVAEISDAELSILDRMGGIFTPRLSSTYSKALKTEVSFRLKKGSLSLMHERVDPGYRTLGALFFNNDFENFTVGGNAVVLSEKLKFTGRAGIQRNNIRDTESNSENRFIGSLMATYQYSENLNFSAQYSNFRTTNKLRASTIPIIEIDTVFLSLVNQNITLGFQNMRGADKKNVLSGSFGFQKSSSIENDEVLDSLTMKNYIGNISYSHFITDGEWTVTGSILTNSNSTASSDFMSIAPTVGIMKPLYDKKVRLTASMSLVNVRLNGAHYNNMLRPTLGVQYRYEKSHTLKFYTSFVAQRINPDLPINRNFNQLRSKLAYNYRF